MINRRHLMGISAATVLSPAMIGGAAGAQAWPARFVRIIVPYAAGTPADTVSRIVGSSLSDVWGVQVVIENRPGGGANIGSEAVARANPDGQTILCAGFAMVTNRYLFNRLGYDAVGDFAPVTLLCTYPIFMTVPNSSPARSVMDFIAFAKEKKRKVTFASPGVGTSPHLSGELFKRMAGIEMTPVQYRDQTLLNDLIAGRVDLAFTGALEQIRAGRVRALAVSSAERFPAAPELPTIAEAGVPGFDVSTWLAFFVPAKTPGEIIRKMNADTVAVLANPAVKTKLELIGVVPVSSTPEGLAAFFKSEMNKWGPLIKQAGIKIDE